MERLSGLDSAFLSFETSSMHLHVAMVAVLDTATMPEPYSFERLKRFIAGRLDHMPTAHRRAVQVPFRLNHPIWVEDPDYDIDHHVRRHSLPPPGGAAELSELVGTIVGTPLDRGRPLWEIHVIEGLAAGAAPGATDGSVALIGKIHHSAVDGVSGAELFVHLFDLTPDAPERPPAPRVEPERIPSDAELVGFALWSQYKRSLTLPALMGYTAQRVGRLLQRHRDSEATVGALPLTAPRTPWSAAITPHRSIAFARVSLGDVKAVKNHFGVKVNDVMLAVVSGAVRRYLLDRHALPRAPLVAMCPVSVRTEEGGGRYDNQVSPMFVHLRTDVADPAEALRAIARSTTGAKEDHKAVGARLLQDWAEHAAPSTFALATRVYSRLNLADRHTPVYNLVVSNVPGPDFPLYMAGAALQAAFPIGPISEGAGLNVTVLSINDNVDVGFVACRELTPDLAVMASHIDDAMAGLLEAAGLTSVRARSDTVADAAPSNGVAGPVPSGNGSGPAPPSAEQARPVTDEAPSVTDEGPPADEGPPVTDEAAPVTDGRPPPADEGPAKAAAGKRKTRSGTKSTKKGGSAKAPAGKRAAGSKAPAERARAPRGASA
ncbi:MAG TPA: wax ester/triacylglycerol synthase family O-acyltransferase [Acidimicrobiales bacterium]|nr:wax ester/triacylglycerol synthase family O-acyltransferase [Acidimicrobiales bacterium]